MSNETGWRDGPQAYVAWLLALGGGAIIVFVLVWVLVKVSRQNADIVIALR
jgi:hypothetical protein